MQQALKQIEVSTSGKGFTRLNDQLNGWVRSTGIQLGVLHRWAVVPSSRSPADGRRTAVAWMTDPAGLEWIAGAGWISSPRKVIALEDGAFSRAAERSLPRTSYQLFEWNLTPRWLDNG